MPGKNLHPQNLSAPSSASGIAPGREASIHLVGPALSVPASRTTVAEANTFFRGAAVLALRRSRHNTKPRVASAWSAFMAHLCADLRMHFRYSSCGLIHTSTSALLALPGPAVSSRGISERVEEDLEQCQENFMCRLCPLPNARENSQVVKRTHISERSKKLQSDRFQRVM